MFNAIARKIVDALSSHSEISKEDEELYVYGFHMMCAQGFFFLLSLLFGILFGIVLESLVFFIFFSLIRSYAGGVHAEKESVCTISTSIALFSAVGLIKWSTMGDNLLIPLLMILVSALIILAFAPLDTQEKPLDREEKRQFQKISYLLLLFICVAAFLALAVQMNGIFHTCTVSLGLEGILLFLGHLKQKLAN